MSDDLDGTKLDMLALALRKQFSPTWGGTPTNNQQTSQTGVGDMMNPLAKALMSKGGAAPGGPSAGSSISAIAPADTSSLYGLSGIPADLGAGGSSTSGLLPGSIAGADMSDTAAYTPDIMEASSPGAGSGLSTLGGLGVGAGAMAGLAAFNNYFRQNHEMTAGDYLKQWGGQSAAALQEAAAAKARGDAAAAQHYQALANTTKGLSNLTSSALAGNYVPDVTTNRDPGYSRNAKPF